MLMWHGLRLTAYGLRRRLVLRAWADPNKTDQYGYTALMEMACCHEDQEYMERLTLLVKGGSKLNATSVSGELVIDIARQCDNSKTLSYLFEITGATGS